MTIEELGLFTLRMAALSDEDESEGADPLILEENDDVSDDDVGEDIVDDDEEKAGEKEVGFGSDEEKEDGKVSLEELREKELG